MKILILQPKMIGDVLTSSILFEILRKEFPDADLHYAINKNTLAVVEGNPFIDEFIILDTDFNGKKSNLVNNIRRVRKNKYDVIIDAYGKLSTNFITLFSSCPITISKFKWYTSFIYKYPITYYDIPKTNAGLAIENRLQLLEPMNFGLISKVKPKIYLSAADREQALQQLNEHNIDLNKPLFMISAMGSNDIKSYPLDYMSQILDLVADRIECNMLLNYIPDQQPLMTILVSKCKESTRDRIKVDLYGKSLRNFIALTSYCTALIGNEGGAVNMAKAIDVPTFTIFSPWIMKDDWNIFEDHKNVSVHLKDYKPKLFANQDGKAIKKSALQLYKLFEPHYFEDQLKRFLKQFKNHQDA
ncbi:MAG: glycosyltransferase family 9 protein [Flavobacteriaceae bacterium]|nr:glycosyltransferase family 9 protein [Flavobacteriaceae bacterium]